MAESGVPVDRMTGVLPSSGMIAFQSEDAAIDFRHLELTPLPAAKDLNPDAAVSRTALCLRSPVGGWSVVSAAKS